MTFNLQRCVYAFNSQGYDFQISSYCSPIKALTNTLVNINTGEIIETAGNIVSIAGGIFILKELANLIKERKAKQNKVDRCFPQLHKAICDPGYKHEQFNDIHPGNKEAVDRLISKWLAPLPLLPKIAEQFGYHVWKDIKLLEKEQCDLKQELLAGNIIGIGSAKSTFVTEKALGYDKKLDIQDSYKGILRWEFYEDYESDDKVKQKIEDWTKGRVRQHETRPYYFYDNNISEPLEPPLEKSLPDCEYAVITKIPNKLCKISGYSNKSVIIFEGLHSYGTKSIEALIWQHIDEIYTKFYNKKINSFKDSYQILFSFPLERYDNNPNKAYEPNLNGSEVEVEKLSSKKVKDLPDYTS